MTRNVTAVGASNLYLIPTTPILPWNRHDQRGVHEPSFGKEPPLRWDDETPANTIDEVAQHCMQ